VDGSGRRGRNRTAAFGTGSLRRVARQRVVTSR
jgi:hypothetical protein